MSSSLNVVIGLGASGYSAAQFLIANGENVAVIDTRPAPPNLADFKKTYPDVLVSCGGWDEKILHTADRIILSPGISLQTPAIAAQIKRGIPVIGDIELFALNTTTPVIAITGTNAKSTVTTLVGKMAEESGFKVGVGGNLGLPCLDLFKEKDRNLFVLEVSSFQLETTYSLAPSVATILNITEDHMDRYANLEAYRMAKQRVYNRCEVAVFNKDDPLTDCGDQYIKVKLAFTLGEPKQNEFGLLQKNNDTWLAFEDTCLMPINQLPVLGKHYQANALAALAIGYGQGFSFEAMLQTLKTFKGLPHRCQWVRELRSVNWYNDSKGTNVGATQAAIMGLGSSIEGKIVLIAGGLGKNADFTPLLPVVEKYVKSVVLIGEDAPLLAKVFRDKVSTQFAKSMDEAVNMCNQLASPKDAVLLSPACASYDMFNNFEHRGDVFTQNVMELN